MLLPGCHEVCLWWWQFSWYWQCYLPLLLLPPPLLTYSTSIPPLLSLNLYLSSLRGIERRRRHQRLLLLLLLLLFFTNFVNLLRLPAAISTQRGNQRQAAAAAERA
jgi:hypothetical protein